MLSCPCSLTIWSEIIHRLCCVVPTFRDWAELMLWASSSCSTAPSVLRMRVLQTLVYTIWQQRNNMLFNHTISLPLVAFKDINDQVVSSIYELRTSKKFRAFMQLWLI
ncbi:hypothetical protein F2Q70_00027231 [Brassica cretica]|uniref:Uncharacterized protein n=1 Tax=Brassica cretica TaxID=69181 RepID=A0A8S9LIM3_BRACR|nr:hypothetical protein F2Q70_00027231 [Brassica cretica]